MTHEHNYRPTPKESGQRNTIEMCTPCGAMRIVEPAEVIARRNAATVAFKQRYNAAYSDARFVDPPTFTNEEAATAFSAGHKAMHRAIKRTNG